MPLPFILGAAAVSLIGYGAKKGIDGYQDSSRADEIIEKQNARRDRIQRSQELAQEKQNKELKILDKLELDIVDEFKEFQKLAERLGFRSADKLQDNTQTVKINSHIEKLMHTADAFAIGLATGVLAGGAASFATYAGVMSFAAASTGTAISSLSGVAAYNATMAAIGGGSLAAGGLGMAGGTVILSAVATAPLIAILGHTYANKAEEKLKEAYNFRDKVDGFENKVNNKIIPYFNKVIDQVDKLYWALRDLRKVFVSDYLQPLREAERIKLSGQSLRNIEDELKRKVMNGYILGNVIAEIIITPFFKLKESGDNIIILKDRDGLQILNTEEIEQNIQDGNTSLRQKGLIS
ncbi:chemotaxis protein [Mergibacter septicus]|uniref:hypothetical protein n=1 Tax=Mergibacter septicus TaxID=221402 RepID=UPI001C7579DB|nr:hypothetical protein [Mergibacter septicus]QDJ13203.1 chemotaxis protein [Mergibacter septicus]